MAQRRDRPRARTGHGGLHVSVISGRATRQHAAARVHRDRASGRPHILRQAAQDADWPAYGRTAARSGVSVSSPAPGQVRRAWTAAVDGAVYAQPLIIGSEVIVATENDTVYALDASTGAVRWSRHLASPVPSGLPCGNVDPSGITGTPVADVAAGRLWVVTFTSAPAYRHTLWSLSLATGTTVSQRPVDVSGSDPRACSRARPRGADPASRGAPPWRHGSSSLGPHASK